jgi:hypothetical protein
VKQRATTNIGIANDGVIGHRVWTTNLSLEYGLVGRSPTLNPDPKQNNGKTVAQIVDHVSADKLVLWGWNPGEDRTIPPLSHDEFTGKFRDWARYGAACPE